MKLVGPRREHGGRPVLDPRREAYRIRFGLSHKMMRKNFTAWFLDVLDACKDDASRRILLGVSK